MRVRKKTSVHEQVSHLWDHAWGGQQSETGTPAPALHWTPGSDARVAFMWHSGPDRSVAGASPRSGSCFTASGPNMCAIHKLGKSRDVPGGGGPAGSHPVETVPLGGTGSRSSCSSGCNSSPDRSPPRRLGRRQNVLQCASGSDALRGKLAWSVLGGRGDPRQRSELGWRTSASPPSPWAATHFRSGGTSWRRRCQKPRSGFVAPLRGSLRTPDGSSDVRNVAHQQAPNGCEGPALPLARGDQKVT